MTSKQTKVHSNNMKEVSSIMLLLVLQLDVSSIEGVVVVLPPVVLLSSISTTAVLKAFYEIATNQMSMIMLVFLANNDVGLPLPSSCYYHLVLWQYSY